MINGVAAHPQVIHRFSPKLKRQFQDALLWNRVEHNLDRRRHAASAAYGATTPRRMAMRHGGGARSGRKGSRSGAFGRLCRTKAQAGRPWIHAAFRPCGTRAAFAATNVAAHAGAKEHVTHKAINTILQQSVSGGSVADSRKQIRHAFPRLCKSGGVCLPCLPAPFPCQSCRRMIRHGTPSG